MHRVSKCTLYPLALPKKAIGPRVSDRTMVGVLEPPRFACVASEPKASNHRVMKPSNRNRRLPWSVRNTSRTQSLSRSEIGLDASRQIHLLSERTEGKSFLDIPSHRAHRSAILIRIWPSGSWHMDEKSACWTDDCAELLFPSDGLHGNYPAFLQSQLSISCPSRLQTDLYPKFCSVDICAGVSSEGVYSSSGAAHEKAYFFCSSAGQPCHTDCCLCAAATDHRPSALLWGSTDRWRTGLARRAVPILS